MNTITVQGKRCLREHQVKQPYCFHFVFVFSFLKNNSNGFILFEQILMETADLNAISNLVWAPFQSGRLIRCFHKCCSCCRCIAQYVPCNKSPAGITCDISAVITQIGGGRWPIYQASDPIVISPPPQPALSFYTNRFTSRTICTCVYFAAMWRFQTKRS